jgi:hypothetical protein
MRAQVSPLPPGKMLRGLIRHWCGYWYQPLLMRKEPFEQTLGLFDAEERFGSNEAVFFRPAYVYAANEAGLRYVAEALAKSPEIATASVQHSASDIGLPWILAVTHRDGFEITYDGLLFCVTEAVTLADMDLSELGAQPGWPLHCDHLIQPLARVLAQVIPDFHDLSYCTLSFYTTEQVDWAAVGLTANHDSQVLLSCVDPNIHTITGLTDHSAGRKYTICLGRPADSLQMMAYTLAHNFEIEFFCQRIDAMRQEATGLAGRVAEAQGQLLRPASQLRARYRGWQHLKAALRRLVELRAQGGQLELVRLALERTVARRSTATSAEVQIWNPQDPPDPVLRRARVRADFQPAQVAAGRLTALSDAPAEPYYARTVIALATKLELLKSALRQGVEEGRSVMVGFQTEFTIYAVVLALAGVAVAVATALVSLWRS